MEFKSYSQCLSSSAALKLKQDCARVFDCKSVDENDDNYSTGSTYFKLANEKPSCLLEYYAQSIFLYHTRGLAFDPNSSGFEWWTQVIDSDDDIGFHWDRDYG